MITLFRLIRCWQLKVKWQFELMHLFDQKATKLAKHPEAMNRKAEGIEKKFIDIFAQLIYDSNRNPSETKESSFENEGGSV